MFRFRVSPQPQFAHDRQRLGRKARQTGHPPPPFAVFGLLDLRLPLSHFIPEPSGSPQGFDLPIQQIPQRFQVHHIEHRVLDLALRQRPAAPVGSRLALAQRLVQQLLKQCAVSCRVFQADQTGRDLRVKQSGRAFPGRFQAETQLLAASMGDRFASFDRQQFPKRRHLLDGQRVDHREAFRDSHLD